MITAQHTHLHLNVQRTLTHQQVTEDMERAFGLGADTVGMCELETRWHHSEFQRCARKYGYAFYLPDWGDAGYALGLACRIDYGAIIFEKTVLCVPGRAHVSPNRYVARIKVRRHADRWVVNAAETHQYSSGWTGSKSLDAFRKARWYIGMKVVQSVERRAAKHNHVVIGGGDLNRPPSTFPEGQVLDGLLNPGGMASVGYAHTDATHGRTTFDYLWFMSKQVHVDVADWSTPSFNSDHDGVLATLEWRR